MVLYVSAHTPKSKPPRKASTRVTTALDDEKTDPEFKGTADSESMGEDSTSGSGCLSVFGCGSESSDHVNRTVGAGLS